MMPTIVSFYTPDNDGGYYKKHYERLLRECWELGLAVYVKEMSFYGRPWEQVLKEKPGVILEALDAVRGPVLWIDVDGSILQKPRVIEETLAQRPDTDLMAVLKQPEKGRPFYMGCVFYNNTEGAREFLREWHGEYAKEDSEEVAFGRAWNRMKGMVALAPLPREYMRIEGQDPITPSTVVIHRLSKGKTKGEFYARMKKK